MSLPLRHLPLSHRQPGIQHELAARKAARSEVFQDAGEVRLLTQKLRKEYRVFDCHSSSLSQMWGSGVSRIANEYDATSMPGRRHEHGVHGAINHRSGIRDLFAQRSNRFAVLCEAIA